jgi:cellulose synthase/poly-beta-1,6-N-acetylglucosamine synthase-like glycosyltransferase
MLILDVISVVLLSVLLFWTVYNGSVIYLGFRKKRKGSAAVYSGEYPAYSIIVPTKNEETVIDRCLNSLLNVDYPKNKLQILVIDGDSSDSTLKICTRYQEKYPQTFKVISEKGANGKPGALNLALPYATGDIIGVFDADSLLDKEVLKKVSSYFDDKEVMAVQGKTTSVNERNNFLTRVISMEEKAWYQALINGREKLQLFVSLNGSCQFVRRSILQELGGWDETSLTEDVELALRLIEKKQLIKYAPDVTSAQETPGGLKDLVKQRVRWYRGYMETSLKYGRLMDKLNRRTIDAEISLAGPFMMVVSLASYINWFLVSLFFGENNGIVAFTGVVIALTAVSLLLLGATLTVVEKPFKLRNLLWIPAIYVYWLLEMCIAGWAFLKLVFRRKRVWSKTMKKGVITLNSSAP